MIKRSSIVFFLFCLAWQGLVAQDVPYASLDKISVEKGFINVWIKAMQDGKPARLDKDKIKLIESYKGKTDTIDRAYSIRDTIVMDTVKAKEHTVLFVVDLSYKIDDADIETAKDLISQILNSYQVFDDPKFYLTVFHEVLV